MQHTRLGRSLPALLLVLAACQGGDSSAPITVARVTVAGTAALPGADTLTVGDRRTFIATLVGSNGAPLAGRRVSWSTSDASVATVDSTGTVSAVAPGRASVLAESEGVRGELAFAVQKRPVARVTFERAVDTVWIGRTTVLRALAQAADGSTLADRAVTWTTEDTSVVAVETASDGSAVVRAKQLGAARLLARSENAGATLPVVVVRVPVARLVLAGPDTVLLGREVTVRATAYAPDGSVLTPTDLYARLVDWSSDRPSTLYVGGLADSAGQTTSGLTAAAGARASGNATITASLDGASARYTVITARAPVAKITFSASSIALAAGGTATVVGDARDADGFAVPEAPMVYAVTSGTDVIRLVATSTPSGVPAARIETIGAGTATMNVTVDGRTASLTVTVAAAANGPLLHVYPTSVTALTGATGRLTVALTDPFGASQPLGTVAYRSTDPSVVTVDASGRITTVARGAASVEVSWGGTKLSVPVSVVAAPASQFHIDVRPVGNVPPAVLAAAQSAAQRWERVVTSAVTPAQVDLNPGTCDVGTPALHQVVTSLVVFLKTERIDGPRGVLAFAGPCVVHDYTSGGLPLVGSMTVDSADVGMLTSGATSALAEDVLTHELGHVLGIGTLWEGGTPAGALLSYATGDPRFIGKYASDATVRLGLSTSASDATPVEDTGGAGTAGGHWRERTFTGELMTGWINTAPNPLSIVTVQSLRDLGYAVTETGADIVSPSTIAGGPAFLSSVAPMHGPSLNRVPLSSPIALGERLITPKFVANQRGTRPRPTSPAP